MPGKSGRAFFISAIQVFWLVEVTVADRIATLPLPSGRASFARLRFIRPISSLDEGLRCSIRPSFATAESQEMTLMPRCIARFSEGARASGSLADTAMASTRWEISALITSIWPSAVVLVGPV